MACGLRTRLSSNVSPLMTSATIKLFLPYGDAKRLRVGEVSNWTGKALAAPRTELDDLLLREEAESAGIYFLFGSDPESKTRGQKTRGQVFHYYIPHATIKSWRAL
jgi:hypothetical protein